jgi:hypothetical protein
MFSQLFFCIIAITIFCSLGFKQMLASTFLPDRNLKIDRYQAARTNNSKIEGIYFVTTYGVGIGGGIIPNFRPYLLFKDGSIYKKLNIAPEYLDIQKSKQEQPQNWGKWKSQGRTIDITWQQGKPQTWKKWYVGMPANASDKLSGKYRTIGGGGNTAFGGDVAIVSSNTINFTPDGRFSLANSRGATSSSSTVTSNSNTSGKYQLKGYTLTLQFDDGKTQNLAFYFYTDKNGVKDPKAIGIGENNYFKRK